MKHTALAFEYWREQRFPGRGRIDDPIQLYPSSRPGWWDGDDAQQNDPGCDCDSEPCRKKHCIDADDHNRRLELLECLACGERWCQAVERTEWHGYDGDRDTPR